MDLLGGARYFTALDLLPHPLVVVTAGDPERPGRRGSIVVAWVSRAP